MKSCRNHIKSYLIAALMLCMSVYVNNNTKGQDDDFEMTITNTSVSKTNVKDGIIQIQTDRADSEYDYLLYDKEPWNGGKLLDEKKTSEQEAAFTSLGAGHYYVCVRNSSKVSRCQDITIKSN
jgi:hypothetical protein